MKSTEVENNVKVTKSTEVENNIDLTKSIEVENNVKVTKSTEIESNIEVVKSTEVEKFKIKKVEELMNFDENLGINDSFNINLLGAYKGDIDRPQTLFLRTRPLVHDSLRVFF